MSQTKLPPGPMCVHVMQNPVTGKKYNADNFHLGSFRFVPIPGPKNTKATILIGCPKGGERVWNAERRKKITDRQGKDRVIVGVCSVKGHPDEGATHGYMKLQKPVKGKCRKGYKLKGWKNLARPSKD